MKNDPQYAHYLEELREKTAGPPKWVGYRRKPHQYEHVDEDEEEGGGGGGGGEGSSHHNAAVSQSMTDLATGMSWDSTDMLMRMPPSLNKKHSLGNIVSASQPNLASRKELAGAFPHLKRPERVTEGAFLLRKLRLAQHTYEDVDILEWPEVGDASRGVHELNSAMRESWLEGGEERLPKGWQRRKDDGGNTFYWHVPTGRTQYTKPIGEEIRPQVGKRRGRGGGAG